MSEQTTQSATRPKYHITCDIDWSPDFAVYRLAKELQQSGIAATFFVTHESDVLSDLREMGHSLGVHPNFLHGSSHGTSTHSVMEHVLEIVPEATIMRTHCLYQSSRIFEVIARDFSNVRIDLSLLTYQSHFVSSTWLHFEDAAIRRINYNWEDDIAVADPGIDWIQPRELSPVAIYDFHPIHVALNSSHLSQYRQLVKALTGQPLQTATPGLVAQFVSSGPGVGTYLNALTLKPWTHVQLSDIP